MTTAIITTVIPTFRRPILLKRAIESVLTQSFKDVIVCVYDNASGDDTEKIVREFIERDNRVLYYKNSENIGAQANIIKGLAAVTTPFYSLLSDDDFLLPDFYETAVKEFNANPNIGFVCLKTMVIDLISKKIQYRNQDWKPGLYEPSNEVVSKMYLSHFVTTSVLLSTKLRETIGSFEPSGSDSLYMTIAAAAVPFVVLDNYGGALTLHEEAYSVIGEGIVKESIPTLYEHLLFTIDNVMTLTLPSERKIHLLMHILKSYQQHFDTKKLNYELNKNIEDGLENILLLPSLTTQRELKAAFYSFFPEKTHFLISACFRLKNTVKKMLATETKSVDWVDLKKEACSLLEERNSDILKLAPYLQPKS